MSMCEACTRGDHANCGMQNWCTCADERDGDPDAAPEYLWDESHGQSPSPHGYHDDDCLSAIDIEAKHCTCGFDAALEGKI